ncbi:hypothetical protein GINT2_000267 [Glugoides intestinalis]
METSMENECTDPRLNISKGISIEKGIYQKIQMLSNKNSILQDNPRPEIVAKTTEVQHFANKIESNNQVPLFWKINDNFTVVCEASTTRTDVFTKRNNIDTLLEYIEKAYSDKCLVISFRRSGITKSFKRCVVFDNIHFNLQDACEVARISRFWLESGENRTVLLEMKNGKEEIILFVLACTLACCKMFWSAEAAVNTLLMTNTLEFQFKHQGSILRYARYYDQIASFNSTFRVPQKTLNQVIITTIPTILKSSKFSPKLKINGVEFAPEKCYFDNNYIVFSNLNTEIDMDVTLSLSFVQDHRTYHVLDLSFNSFFYQQGLHRFTRSEIETDLPQESIYKFFDEQFYVDIVILDNKDEHIKNPYTTSYSLSDAVRSISERFFGDTDEEQFRQLMDQGYPQSLAKLCSNLQLVETECEKLRLLFKEKDHKSIISKSSDLDNEVEYLDKNTENREFFDNEIETELNKNEIEITAIEQLTQRAIERNVIKQTGRGLFGKKKTVSLPAREDLFVIRPLHLAPIKNIENTVFRELGNLKIDIDLKTFEKHFCESPKSEKATKMTQQTKELIDMRRLFIVSLCQKQLEIRKIKVEEIQQILQDTAEMLTQQDLVNISRLVPTESEKKLLLSVEEEMLSPVERSMLLISKVPEIAAVISILLFERIFVEEADSIYKVLVKAISTLSLLITSKEMKVTLKAVLDVSNTISYVYGRKKKAIDGFRLESLAQVAAYSGFNNYLLLDFISGVLIKNEVKIENLKKLADDIEIIKREDLQTLKDRINILIEKYTVAVEAFKEIEKYNKESMKKSLGFACTRLKEIISKYRIFEERVDNLKQNLGDDSTKTVNTILETIQQFLNKLFGVYIRSKR